MTDGPFDSYREFIPEFTCFLDSLERPLPTHLRVNSLKIEPDSLVQMLGKKGIHLKKVDESHETFYLAPELKGPGSLLEYFLGYIHPQALTSCLVPLVLSPKQDSLVLDMCASPGGKTAQCAQLMENRGLVVANELYWNRHIPLSNTLARLGILNTVLTAYQAQEFPLREKFNYILADVPCTGEGRYRVNGGKYRYGGHRGRPLLRELQKKIIIRGFDLLKDDGEMVYSTCTYSPEENESVIDYLLKERDAVLLPIEIDFHHEPGLLTWIKERYDKQLQRAVRFYPHQIDSVGFFMARICRKR